MIFLSKIGRVLLASHADKTRKIVKVLLFFLIGTRENRRYFARRFVSPFLQGIYYATYFDLFWIVVPHRARWSFGGIFTGWKQPEDFAFACAGQKPSIDRPEVFWRWILVLYIEVEAATSTVYG
jgi:hypothetical protein